MGRSADTGGPAAGACRLLRERPGLGKDEDEALIVNATERSYITPQGWQRLQDEYNVLRHEERPKVVEEVSAAAALGDRSENAEYIYGKKRLREIDRRLRYLATRLEHVQQVDPGQMDRDDVSFGATVTVEYEDGRETTYHIVGIDEVDVPRNRISYKSPVGRALMGKRVGDVVVVHRPAGPVELEVLEVKYQELD